MKSAVAALALGAASAAPSAPSFSEWMIAHDKSYSSAAELRLRRGTYERNVEAILEANERYEDAQQSHWLGVNQFADMSPDEFVAMKTAGRTLPVRGATTNAPASDALPASVDWVAKDVVGPVANQGQLGQDWAFAAVEVIESNIAIAVRSFSRAEN
jgi:C1A family cysteine protease